MDPLAPIRLDLPACVMEMVLPALSTLRYYHETNHKCDFISWVAPKGQAKTEQSSQEDKACAEPVPHNTDQVVPWASSGESPLTWAAQFLAWSVRWMRNPFYLVKEINFAFSRTKSPLKSWEIKTASQIITKDNSCAALKRLQSTFASLPHLVLFNSDMIAFVLMGHFIIASFLCNNCLKMWNAKKKKKCPGTLQYCLANKNSGQSCRRFTPKTVLLSVLSQSIFKDPMFLPGSGRLPRSWSLLPLVQNASGRRQDLQLATWGSQSLDPLPRDKNGGGGSFSGWQKRLST